MFATPSHVCVHSVVCRGLEFAASARGIRVLGALGITFGLRYRLSSITFAACYWYLLLIDKSYWNNHSYLFGLVSILLACTEANCRWSIDVLREPFIYKDVIPYWNYFILKYQFFILYFVAGLKKGTPEWLTGYSLPKLSEHWVFSPFTLFLSVDLTDYLIVHWFAFVFDLTIVIWMMWSKTRHVAMIFCGLFHLMNIRLFRIGMFPWVCLATMPLFYPFDWPITLFNHTMCFAAKVRETVRNIYIFTHMNMNNDSNASDANNILLESNNVVDEKLINENINLHISDKNDTRVQDELENSDNEVLQNNVTKYDKYYTREEEELENVDDDLLKDHVTKYNKDDTRQEEELENVDDDALKNDVTKYDREKSHSNRESRKATCKLIFIYIILQAFLPYSHFITKGYNNWTNGLYGYSWDMMVQTWDTISVVVKVVDKNTQQVSYLDPFMFSPNDRWTRHGDMVQQYATCIKDKLKLYEKSEDTGSQDNISIHIDVWSSMNGRFTQRMFDPRVDLLEMTWSIFEPIPFLLPLIDEALDWRKTLHDIREEVYSQNNSTEVIFVADFPGYDQLKYIPNEMTNLTLTVLQGSIAFEVGTKNGIKGMTSLHSEGDQIKVLSGEFHKVTCVGQKPAFYMYTYNDDTEEPARAEPESKLPIGRELGQRITATLTFVKIITSYIFQIIYSQLLK